MHDDLDMPHDRSGRLVLFGIVAILVGIGCAMLGVLQAALPLLARAMPELGTAAAPGAAVAGAFVYLALGAAFVALGWGSINRRRWVRPLMLTMAWTWLLGGAASVALLPWLVPTALAASASGAASPDAVRFVTLVLVLAAAALGVVLPAMFILVYRDPQVQATCERYDPRPSWTERCPTRVLGMAVALIGCGVVMVPFAARPAVPLFGAIIGGGVGAALTLATAVGCVWSAIELYRLRARGWWAVTILLVGLGLSTTVTFAVAEVAEMYRALGLPAELQPADGEGSPRALRYGIVLASTVITLATLVYMLRIRTEIETWPGTLDERR